MARTPLERLITRKSLDFIAIHHNEALFDLIEDGNLKLTEGSPGLELKNVCAKVALGLADEIDKICGLLDISKRRFLEAAFIEAVSRAHEIMRAEGVFDAVEDITDALTDSVGETKESGK